MENNKKLLAFQYKIERTFDLLLKQKASICTAYPQYVNVGKCWTTQRHTGAERKSWTSANIPALIRNIYQHTCSPIGHAGYLRYNASTHVVA